MKTIGPSANDSLYGGLVASWGKMFTVLLRQMALITATPDFGLDGPVRGSMAIHDASELMEEVCNELTQYMDFSVSSSYGELETLRARMMTLAQTVASVGTTFTDALSLAASSNSNVDATFQPIVLPLGQLQTLQLEHLTELLTDIEECVGSPIVLQLKDTFDLIYMAVRTLYGALIQLVSCLQTSNGHPENVEAVIVNLVRRSVLTLRAHILLLSYTLRSTGQGIQVADAFLVRLTRVIESGQSQGVAALQGFQRELRHFHDSVPHMRECTTHVTSGLGQSVTAALEELDSVLEGCVLHTAANSMVELLTTELTRVVCVVQRHYGVLESGSTFLEELTERLGEVYQLGKRLAYVTAANGPYAMYCYNMFAPLVEQLVPRLTDGVTVCLQRETFRLRFLQSTLSNMLQTLVYDVEDLLEHLTLCNTVLDQQEQCMVELGDLYEHLATQTEDKLELLEKFSFAEANASLDRLKLCVLNTTYTVFNKDMVQLVKDVEACRAPIPDGGPL